MHTDWTPPPLPLFDKSAFAGMPRITLLPVSSLLVSFKVSTEEVARVAEDDASDEAGSRVILGMPANADLSNSGSGGGVQSVCMMW